MSTATVDFNASRKGAHSISNVGSDVDPDRILPDDVFFVYVEDRNGAPLGTQVPTHKVGSLSAALVVVGRYSRNDELLRLGLRNVRHKYRNVAAPRFA